MSSYIRLEILLFFRAFETGVGMLVVYRLTDMLKRRLFCDRMRKVLLAECAIC